MLKNSQVCWIVRAELRSSCENIRINLTFMAQTVLFPATPFTGQFGDEIAPGVWLWLVQISLLLPSFFFHGTIMAHSNNSLKKKKAEPASRSSMSSCHVFNLFCCQHDKLLFLLFISSAGCHLLTNPDQHLHTHTAPRELWLWEEHFFGFCFSSFFFRMRGLDDCMT